MRLCTLFAIVLSGFLVSPTSAPAEIIGNLPQNDDDANFTVGGNTDRRWGVGFTMPAASGAPLGSAILRLSVDFTVPDDTPVVELYADSGGGNPTGAALVTFNNPTFTNGVVQDYKFLPSSPFNLAAGTSYWLVVSGAETTNIFSWRGSNNPAKVPAGTATFIGTKFAAGGGLPSGLTVSQDPSFQIIPEPTSLLLFAAGSAVIMRRRR